MIQELIAEKDGDWMDHDMLVQLTKKAYDGLSLNHFATLGRPREPMWEAPFFGLAAGDDPLYDFYKEHIGSFHMNPLQAFQLKYPGEGNPEGLRVLSVCFPQTKKTKDAQAGETLCPAREWIVTRGEWEPMIREFSKAMVDSLEAQGVRCVALDLCPELAVNRQGPRGLASNWSHRHSAYAAGLGTFSLSDGMITRRGIAVRFTSFVLEAPLAVSERPYKDYRQWCLYYSNGTCGLCIGRCPADAITKDGHDKELCAAYEDYFAEHYWPSDIDRKDYILGCGLCQSGVPCRDKNPVE